MAADGRILIDTKIDTRGIIDGSRDIEGIIERLINSIDKLSENIQNIISSAGDSAKTVAENSQVMASEIDGIANSAQVAEQSLLSLNEQMSEIPITGLAQAELPEFEEQPNIAMVNESTYGYDQSVIDYINQYATAAESASEENANLSESEAAVAQSMHEVGGYIGALQASLNGLRTVVTRTIPLLGKGLFTGLIFSLKALAKAAKKAALEMAQLAGRGIVGGLKKIATGIFGLDKATRKSNAGLGMSLKTMIRYGIGVESLYALINKLRSALVEGFKNLAQYSSSTNATLSGLMSSLAQCKNALATAFDPILQAVAPALNYMISLVTAAATAVAQLIAILTGKGTFIKATKVQQDYAKSLKATGGAAKGAGEDAEGALAPFDKLTILADEATSGGGGGGGGAGAISPSDMFETVEVTDSFKKLGDLFKSQDWKGIGEYVAGKLNEGLQKIYDVINWDNVGPQITYFVNAFTETFNSLVDNLDWDLLGRVIGTGINTITYTLNTLFDGVDWINLGKKFGEGANGLVDEVDWYALGQLLLQKLNATIETLYGFITEFDWKEFGTSLGEVLNGAIDSIDPELWADTLSELVKGIFDTIVNFLNGTDWQEIGNKIANFIGGIDYAGISDRLFEGISVAFVSLAKFIWGLVEGAWDKVVTWWKENAYEDGKFTMQGLFDGIVNKMKDIFSWIKEHIFNPIIKGFKSAFGIHSPSTIMTELGGYLIEGLKNGIVKMIPIIETVVGGIVNTIKGLVEKALGFIDQLTKIDARGITSKGASNLLGKFNVTRSFSLASQEPVHLPRLASGTVVPPRAGEFAAILGDNRRETEVVSPLSTMKQAMLEAMAQAGGLGGGDINLAVNLDGRQIYQTIVKRNRMETDRTGMNPLLV